MLTSVSSQLIQMMQYLWLTFTHDPGSHLSPHNFTCTVLPYLAKRRISCHTKAKCFLQSPLPYFRRKLEGLIKNKPYQTHVSSYLSACYLSRAFRLHIYASISPGTEVKPTDVNFAAPSPRFLFSTSLFTGPPLPGHWVCSSLPSLACLWEGTFHGDPIVCTILSGNPRTADVSDDWNSGNNCHKTETMAFPWGVISQAGEGTRELIYDRSLKLHKTDYL